MMNYLILLTSENSKSFCYYDTTREQPGKKNIIDFNLLKNAVLYAIRTKCG